MIFLNECKEDFTSLAFLVQNRASFYSVGFSDLLLFTVKRCGSLQLDMWLQQWYLQGAVFSLFLFKFLSPAHKLHALRWRQLRGGSGAPVPVRAGSPSGPMHPALGAVAAPAVQVQFELGCVGWSSKPRKKRGW